MPAKIILSADLLSRHTLEENIYLLDIRDSKQREYNQVLDSLIK